MKASRWIGVLIVLAAAFAAAYWIGGPPVTGPEGEHPPEGGPQAGPGQEQGPQQGPQEGGMQGPPQEGGMQGPPQEGGMQGPPQQGGMQGPPQDAQVQPGQYNPELLPKPAPSYNDDPQRFAKTYQEAAKLTSPYWRKLGESLQDPQLAGQARGLSERLQDPNTDPLETTHAAMMLENQIRQSGNLDAHTSQLLDYVNQVAATVIQDGDPSAIVRPK